MIFKQLFTYPPELDIIRMKKIIQALIILTISLFIGNACNKPSTIGSDLLPDEDFAELLYTEDIALKTSTIVGDSVRTYLLSEQLSNYLCGRLEDPVCGASTANFTAQFSAISKPELNEPVLDSIVLLLGYADDGHVGQLNNPQSFEVYRIEEDLYSTEEYFSTQMFERGEKIGELTAAVPKVNEDITLRVPYIDGSGLLQYRDSLFSSHLRIPLNMEFGDSLLNFIGSPDFAGLADQFTAFFKGLTVVPSSHNTAMLSLRLNIIGEIRLYYSEQDDNITDLRPREVLFPIRNTSVKTSGFSHDYNTGEIQKFLDNNVSYPEDFTFVQSMEGLLTKVEFPGLANLEDIVVNQAELIFTVVRSSDLDTYPLPNGIGGFQQSEEGTFNGISDFTQAVNQNPAYFNGRQSFAVINDNKVIQYRMYITSFLQGVIDNRHPENALYLFPFFRGEVATRAVLGGSSHNHYPAQLRLTYTRL